MLRLLKYLPVVLSIIGVIRKNRNNSPRVVNNGRSGKRRSTFRK